MVYVDPLMNHGWRLRGTYVDSCHLFADTLEELHEMASKLGLKRSWFQNSVNLAHYDIVGSKRELAVKYGAKELTMREAVFKWKELRGGSNEEVQSSQGTQSSQWMATCESKHGKEGDTEIIEGS